MTRASAVASLLGAFALAVLPACGARSRAWETAMTEMDCHASDTIVRKSKETPGTFVVTACGEERIYQCDEAGDTCVARGITPAPVTGQDEQPLDALPPALDEAPSESAPAEPEADTPPAEAEPASDEAPDEENAEDAVEDDTPTEDAGDGI